MCGGGCQEQAIIVTTSHLSPYLRSPLRMTGKIPGSGSPKAIQIGEGLGNAVLGVLWVASITTQHFSNTDIGAFHMSSR